MPASVAAVVASKQAEEEQQSEVKPRAPALPSEDEPDYDPTLCTLDWYSSDLNLSIVPTDFCSAIAMSQRGFGYMWAGARATQVVILGRKKTDKSSVESTCFGYQGATRGRVCYEVRIDQNQPATHLGQESSPHVLRCGW